MKYVFIVNPNSGAGKSLEVARKLENMAMDREIDYDIYYTERKMDAANFAKKYRNDENVVIFSIGGDGTLNEIVQSMPDAKCKIEVIPSGTGNDFYKTLVTKEDKDVHCDLGHVNKDFFINTMSIGIDSVICKNVDMFRNSKMIPTSKRYTASILYTLFNYEPYNLDIFIEDRQITTKKDKIWLLSICNGTTYGGGFKIAPRAKIDDGLLDVYLVRNCSRAKLPVLIAKLNSGKHESCPEMEHYVTDKIHIKSKDEIVCSLDGELIYDTDFKVTVDNKALVIKNDRELVKESLQPKVLTK